MKARETLKKVIGLTRKQRFAILFSMILSILVVLTQLYIPILFGDIIDQLSIWDHTAMSMIVSRLYLIAVLAVVAGIASYIKNLLDNKVSFAVVEELRNRAFEHIQVLPLAYLDAHKAGELASRLIADADQLSDGLLLGFAQLFTGVITIIVTVYFMFVRNVEITLLVLLLTPLSFLVSSFIAKRSYDMFRKQSETRGQQTGLINEVISNEKLVKAFAQEEKMETAFKQINDELTSYSRLAVFYSSLTNPSTRAVNNVIYALVALWGSYRILTGSLSVGGLSIMLTYASQYMKPFNDIAAVVTELQNSLACAGRVFELIEEEAESADSDRQLVVKKGQVDIEDVCFSYDKSKKLIEHFSFRAKAGSTIAIVGPTGCGKTTFINLLLRFYEPDAGRILLDGTDIREVSRHSLRKNYGMVLQDTWLRNASVRDNINIGYPQASDEQIIAAAKQAHSYEFIRRLPQGLDTILSDDMLSQGQKQLLCITRVMLCMPPILILDEATSNIDTRTEIQIREAFRKLMAGRTSFIVAHRLSTIRNADCILVMKDGQIVEQGDHETLLKQKGFYYELYHAQFAEEEGI